MALPTTRNTNYAVGAQVKSVDLNAIQDAIVDVNALITGMASGYTGITLAANQHVTLSGTGHYKHGDLVRAFHAAAVVDATSGTRTSEALVLGASGQAYLPLNFDVGQRIKSVTFLVLGNGAADLDVRLQKTDAAGVGSQIGATHTVTNPGAAYADSTFDLTDTTVAAGEGYCLMFQPNAGGIRLANIRITYDRP